MLRLALRASCPPGLPLLGAVLRCRVCIEPYARTYGADELGRLCQLFGPPQDWGETCGLSPGGLLWCETETRLPAFEGECGTELLVPCGGDFNIAVAKYLDGLCRGELPLRLRFGGQLLYRDARGRAAVEPIDRGLEARYCLPASVWQGLQCDRRPQGVWLCLHRGVLDRLAEYRRTTGMPSLDDALASLLDEAATAGAPP
jgi:hypothetical protein